MAGCCTVERVKRGSREARRHTLPLQELQAPLWFLRLTPQLMGVSHLFSLLLLVFIFIVFFSLLSSLFSLLLLVYLSNYTLVLGGHDTDISYTKGLIFIPHKAACWFPACPSKPSCNISEENQEPLFLTVMNSSLVQENKTVGLLVFLRGLCQGNLWLSRINAFSNRKVISRP